MYLPAQFQETREDVLREAIASIRLALIVTAHDGAYYATHAPMVAWEGDGPLILTTHVARANDHWRAVADGLPSLAVFQGPQAYISPSYYASKRVHGKVVPTWNYIAVHATGTLRAHEDAAFIVEQVRQLTDASEAGRAEPWRVSDAPDGFIERTARGIVGMTLSVNTLEGAWKMTQHKPEADRHGAIAGLAASATPAERTVAEVMAGLERTRA